MVVCNAANDIAPHIDRKICDGAPKIIRYVDVIMNNSLFKLGPICLPCSSADAGIGECEFVAWWLTFTVATLSKPAQDWRDP
jgi:hypothetical protein